jgi:lipoprotein-anchoring transpeptidase ErfK/SrfK
VLGFVVVGVVASLITSCSSSTPEGQAGSTNATSTSSTPPPKPVVLTASTPDQAGDVAPGLPVTVTAADGKISQVVLTNPEGAPVAGTLTPDSLKWVTTEPLGYGKTYTLAITGQGVDAKPVTKTSTFTTVQPRTLTALATNPVDGSVVGVGQPLAFYFDEPITDKLAAEANIQITTEPKVEGAFYWFDDKQVHWRPQAFWAAGTKVTIDGKIYGKNLGNGVYGQEDLHVTTTIGDSVIHEADGESHQVVTKVNGVVTRTVPTSMGNAANTTPVGTYVITVKHDHMVMDSTTYGLSLENGGYKTPVDWATRMSNSGIFVHSAPWSVGDQGYRNVSHGCLNMSPENAKFFFDNAKPGDVVIVANSGGPQLEPTDGFGDWQVPWTEWVAGNR